MLSVSDCFKLSFYTAWVVKTISNYAVILYLHMSDCTCYITLQLSLCYIQHQPKPDKCVEILRINITM